MSKAFRQVVSLWITPDFTAVEKGLEKPPYVNHDEVDFGRLAQFLDEFNRCGEPVRIRVANDTVDQVTLFKRANDPSLDLRDFAQAVLLCDRSGEPMIDVRQAWRPLHLLQNRLHAPPPSVLMFVLEGEFEAVIMWLSQLTMRLRIPAADPMIMLAGSAAPKDYEGQLPKPLLEYLQTAFGVKFKAVCQCHRTQAHTDIPAWAAKNPFER